MPQIDPRQVQAALEQGLISEEDAQALLQQGSAGMEDSEALEGHGPGEESSMQQEGMEEGMEEEQGGAQRLDQETLIQLLSMLADPHVSPAQKSRIAQIIVESYGAEEGEGTEEEDEAEYGDQEEDMGEGEPDEDDMMGMEGPDIGSMLQQATAMPSQQRVDNVRKRYASPLG